MPHLQCQVPDTTRGVLQTRESTRTRARGYGLVGGWVPKSVSLPPSPWKQRTQARLFSFSASASPLWRLVGFGDSREWLRCGVVLRLNVFSGRQRELPKKHINRWKSKHPSRSDAAKVCSKQRKSGDRHAHFLPAAVPEPNLEP